MKATDKKKSIKTIPKGVWEGSHPQKKKPDGACTQTTDLQGNGYPTNKQGK